MEFPKFKKVAMLAAFFTIAMLAVNYLFTLIFGSSVKASLFAITSYPSMIPTPVQTFGTGIGASILNWINGYVALPNFGTIVMLFLSALVLIYVGSFIVSLGAWTVKGKVGSIFSTVAWGTIVGYAVLVGFTIPSAPINTIIGFVIYTAVASYLAALLGSVTKQDL